MMNKLSLPISDYRGLVLLFHSYTHAFLDFCEWSDYLLSSCDELQFTVTHLYVSHELTIQSSEQLHSITMEYNSLTQTAKNAEERLSELTVKALEVHRRYIESGEEVEEIGRQLKFKEGRLREARELMAALKKALKEKKSKRKVSKLPAISAPPRLIDSCCEAWWEESERVYKKCVQAMRAYGKDRGVRAAVFDLVSVQSVSDGWRKEVHASGACQSNSELYGEGEGGRDDRGVDGKIWESGRGLGLDNLRDQKELKDKNKRSSNAGSTEGQDEGELNYSPGYLKRYGAGVVSLTLYGDNTRDNTRDDTKDLYGTTFREDADSLYGDKDAVNLYGKSSGENSRTNEGDRQQKECSQTVSKEWYDDEKTMEVHDHNHGHNHGLNNGHNNGRNIGRGYDYDLVVYSEKDDQKTKNNRLNKSSKQSEFDGLQSTSTGNRNVQFTSTGNRSVPLLESKSKLNNSKLKTDGTPKGNTSQTDGTSSDQLKTLYNHYYPLSSTDSSSLQNSSFPHLHSYLLHSYPNLPSSVREDIVPQLPIPPLHLLKEVDVEMVLPPLSPLESINQTTVRHSQRPSHFRASHSRPFYSNTLINNKPEGCINKASHDKNKLSKNMKKLMKDNEEDHKQDIVGNQANIYTFNNHKATFHNTASNLPIPHATDPISPTDSVQISEDNPSARGNSDREGSQDNENKNLVREGSFVYLDSISREPLEHGINQSENGINWSDSEYLYRSGEGEASRPQDDKISYGIHEVASDNVSASIERGIHHSDGYPTPTGLPSQIDVLSQSSFPSQVSSQSLGTFIPHGSDLTNVGGSNQKTNKFRAQLFLPHIHPHLPVKPNAFAVYQLEKLSRRVRVLEIALDVAVLMVNKKSAQSALESLEKVVIPMIEGRVTQVKASLEKGKEQESDFRKQYSHLLTVVKGLVNVKREAVGRMVVLYESQRHVGLTLFSSSQLTSQLQKALDHEISIFQYLKLRTASALYRVVDAAKKILDRVGINYSTGIGSGLVIGNKVNGGQYRVLEHETLLRIDLDTGLCSEDGREGVKGALEVLLLLPRVFECMCVSLIEAEDDGGVVSGIVKGEMCNDIICSSKCRENKCYSNNGRTQHSNNGRTQHSGNGRTQHSGNGRTQHSNNGRTQHSGTGRTQHFGTGRTLHSGGGTLYSGKISRGSVSSEDGSIGIQHQLGGDNDSKRGLDKGEIHNGSLNGDVGSQLNGMNWEDLDQFGLWEGVENKEMYITAIYRQLKIHHALHSDEPHSDEVDEVDLRQIEVSDIRPVSQIDICPQREERGSRIGTEIMDSCEKSKENEGNSNKMNERKKNGRNIESHGENSGGNGGDNNTNNSGGNNHKNSDDNRDRNSDENRDRNYVNNNDENSDDNSDENSGNWKYPYNYSTDSIDSGNVELSNDLNELKNNELNKENSELGNRDKELLNTHNIDSFQIPSPPTYTLHSHTLSSSSSPSLSPPLSLSNFDSLSPSSIMPATQSTDSFPISSVCTSELFNSGLNRKYATASSVLESFESLSLLSVLLPVIPRVRSLYTDDNLNLKQLSHRLRVLDVIMGDVMKMYSSTSMSNKKEDKSECNKRNSESRVRGDTTNVPMPVMENRKIEVEEKYRPDSRVNDTVNDRVNDNITKELGKSLLRDVGNQKNNIYNVSIKDSIGYDEGDAGDGIGVVEGDAGDDIGVVEGDAGDGIGVVEGDAGDDIGVVEEEDIIKDSRHILAGLHKSSNKTQRKKERENNGKNLSEKDPNENVVFRNLGDEGKKDEVKDNIEETRGGDRGERAVVKKGISGGSVSKDKIDRDTLYESNKVKLDDKKDELGDRGDGAEFDVLRLGKSTGDLTPNNSIHFKNNSEMFTDRDVGTPSPKPTDISATSGISQVDMSATSAITQNTKKSTASLGPTSIAPSKIFTRTQEALPDIQKDHRVPVFPSVETIESNTALLLALSWSQVPYVTHHSVGYNLSKTASSPKSTSSESLVTLGAALAGGAVPPISLPLVFLSHACVVKEIDEVARIGGRGVNHVVEVEGSEGCCDNGPIEVREVDIESIAMVHNTDDNRNNFDNHVHKESQRVGDRKKKSKGKLKGKNVNQTETEEVDKTLVKVPSRWCVRASTVQSGGKKTGHIKGVEYMNYNSMRMCGQRLVRKHKVLLGSSVTTDRGVKGKHDNSKNLSHYNEGKPQNLALYTKLVRSNWRQVVRFISQLVKTQFVNNSSYSLLPDVDREGKKSMINYKHQEKKGKSEDNAISNTLTHTLTLLSPLTVFSTSPSSCLILTGQPPCRECGELSKLYHDHRHQHPYMSRTESMIERHSQSTPQTLSQYHSQSQSLSQSLSQSYPHSMSQSTLVSSFIKSSLEENSEVYTGFHRHSPETVLLQCSHSNTVSQTVLGLTDRLDREKKGKKDNTDCEGEDHLLDLDYDPHLTSSEYPRYLNCKNNYSSNVPLHSLNPEDRNNLDSFGRVQVWFDTGCIVGLEYMEGDKSHSDCARHSDSLRGGVNECSMTRPATTIHIHATQETSHTTVFRGGEQIHVTQETSHTKTPHNTMYRGGDGRSSRQLKEASDLNSIGKDKRMNDGKEEKGLCSRVVECVTEKHTEIPPLAPLDPLHNTILSVKSEAQPISTLHVHLLPTTANRIYTEVYLQQHVAALDRVEEGLVREYITEVDNGCEGESKDVENKKGVVSKTEEMYQVKEDLISFIEGDFNTINYREDIERVKAISESSGGRVGSKKQPQSDNYLYQHFHSNYNNEDDGDGNILSLFLRCTRECGSCKACTGDTSHLKRRSNHIHTCDDHSEGNREVYKCLNEDGHFGHSLHNLDRVVTDIELEQLNCMGRTPKADSGDIKRVVPLTSQNEPITLTIVGKSETISKLYSDLSRSIDVRRGLPTDNEYYLDLKERSLKKHTVETGDDDERLVEWRGGESIEDKGEWNHHLFSPQSTQRASHKKWGNMSDRISSLYRSSSRGKEGFNKDNENEVGDGEQSKGETSKGSVNKSHLSSHLSWKSDDDIEGKIVRGNKGDREGDIHLDDLSSLHNTQDSTQDSENKNIISKKSNIMKSDLDHIIPCSNIEESERLSTLNTPGPTRTSFGYNASYYPSTKTTRLPNTQTSMRIDWGWGLQSSQSFIRGDMTCLIPGVNVTLSDYINALRKAKKYHLYSNYQASLLTAQSRLYSSSGSFETQSKVALSHSTPLLTSKSDIDHSGPLSRAALKQNSVLSEKYNINDPYALYRHLNRSVNHSVNAMNCVRVLVDGRRTVQDVALTRKVEQLLGEINNKFMGLENIKMKRQREKEKAIKETIQDSDIDPFNDSFIHSTSLKDKSTSNMKRASSKLSHSVSPKVNLKGKSGFHEASQLRLPSTAPALVLNYMETVEGLPPQVSLASYTEDILRSKRTERRARECCERDQGTEYSERKKVEDVKGERDELSRVSLSTADSSDWNKRRLLEGESDGSSNEAVSTSIEESGNEVMSGNKLDTSTSKRIVGYSKQDEEKNEDVGIIGKEKDKDDYVSTDNENHHKINGNENHHKINEDGHQDYREDGNEDYSGDYSEDYCEDYCGDGSESLGNDYSFVKHFDHLDDFESTGDSKIPTSPLFSHTQREKVTANGSQSVPRGKKRWNWIHNSEKGDMNKNMTENNPIINENSVSEKSKKKRGLGGILSSLANISLPNPFSNRFQVDNPVSAVSDGGEGDNPQLEHSPVSELSSFQDPLSPLLSSVLPRCSYPTSFPSSNPDLERGEEGLITEEETEKRKREEGGWTTEHFSKESQEITEDGGVRKKLGTRILTDGEIDRHKIYESTDIHLPQKSETYHDVVGLSEDIGEMGLNLKIDEGLAQDMTRTRGLKANMRLGTDVRNSQQRDSVHVSSIGGCSEYNVYTEKTPIGKTSGVKRKATEILTPFLKKSKSDSGTRNTTGSSNTNTMDGDKMDGHPTQNSTKNSNDIQSEYTVYKSYNVYSKVKSHLNHQMEGGKTKKTKKTKSKPTKNHGHRGLFGFGTGLWPSGLEMGGLFSKDYWTGAPVSPTTPSTGVDSGGSEASSGHKGSKDSPLWSADPQYSLASARKYNPYLFTLNSSTTVKTESTAKQHSDNSEGEDQYSFIDVTSSSSILTRRQLQLLLSHVPRRFQLEPWTLAFSNSTGGQSWPSLRQALLNTSSRTEREHPSVLLLKDALGNVFGVYNNNQWGTQCGDRLSFVFEFSPLLTVFRWALGDEVFGNVDTKGLRWGGGGEGPAIIIHSDLTVSSYKSDTYLNNPFCLQKDIVLTEFEVWSTTKKGKR